MLYLDLAEIQSRGIDIIDTALVKLEMGRMLQTVHAKVQRKLMIDRSKPSPENPSLPVMSEGDQATWSRVAIALAAEEREFMSTFGGVETIEKRPETFEEFNKRLEDSQGLLMLERKGVQ